jgi:dipeptidyl-peptidase-4
MPPAASQGQSLTTPSDDNLHFQNSLQMINAPIAAGKQFRPMIDPNKTHGIAGTDARVHLFALIAEHFERELKPEPQP